MTALPERGLYAITDRRACAKRGLLTSVELAISGGARMIQYRDKDGDDTRRENEARALLRICRAHGVPLVINDDIALARSVRADGVHLGDGDGDIAHARTELGATAIIGASCYHEMERAVRATEQGATYVAFGRCFPSRNKPGAARVTPEFLRDAVAALGVPVVAIGGINASNAADLVTCGVHMLACIESVFAAPDVAAAARRIDACFAQL